MKTHPLFSQIPIEQLHSGRYQPRRDFNPEALEELGKSIRSSGLIQPIVVRRSSENSYEIIAGERRWRAAQIVGLETVPCLINNYTDEQAAAVTTIENIQRKNLNPIEEAQSFQRLIDDFHYLHEEVAAIVGKSRVQVTNCLRLLRLDERIQQWLITGVLSEGHGKTLASLTQSSQFELARCCVEQAWSVRRLEQEVKSHQISEKKFPSPQSSGNADLMRLERVISDQLGAKVKVTTDNATKGGWLNIQFYDNDTLAGLLEKIGIKEEL